MKANHNMPALEKHKLTEAFGIQPIEFLGRGAFGELWRIDRRDGSAAAKILYQRSWRIEREVQALKRCTSSHVVRFQSSEEITYEGHPMTCLLFEYVPGSNLLTYMERNQRPDWNELKGFATGVLDGLSDMHAQNVVHRDLSPKNIVIRNGSFHDPVIVDLGLARLLDTSTRTTYPSRVGTPLYMAPEQLRGERAGKGCDVWALGVILYQLVVGRHPFYSEQVPDLDEAIDWLLTGPVPIPDTVSIQVRSLILKLLSFESYRRGSARIALTRTKEWEL